MPTPAVGSWVERFLKGSLGFKTIAAAVVLVILVALQQVNLITPEQFETYAKLAEALGLIGLRDAVAKLPK